MSYKNLTTEFFRRLTVLLYLWGFPNLWIQKIYFPKCLLVFHRYLTKFISTCLYLFVTLELLGFLTQRNLSEKQSSDRLLFGLSHPVLIIYYTSIEYHKADIKQILFTLAVDLKKVYNDENVEKLMIRKFKIYLAAYICSFSSALVSYGFDALMQVLHGDGTFTTVITAWPDVEDRSTFANAARVVSYIFWWLFMLRVSAVYVLIISLTICLGHQYKNLQSYFYNLVNIFDEKDLDQVEMEKEYERRIRIGIKLHSDTLWCTRQSQVVCSMVFSGQIMINIFVFCLLMLQMVNSERTLMNALAIVSMSVAMLISTGFVMWNAGDVTVEAARLPTAMYSSGWENCRSGCSSRIRRLIVIAMAQSQRPVVLRSFGVIELSYQSYVSIVKSSYSVFSILY